jgi:hypothetical protein
VTTTPKWIPLKEWLTDRAIELGLSYNGAWERFHRGDIRPKQIQRKNARVILVRV